MRIDDPLTSDAARVVDGALRVAILDSVAWKLAADGGRAAYVSSTYAAGANEEFLYIQNEDSRILVLERVIISTDAASSIRGTLSSGTAAGTDITPVPGNLTVPLARSVELKGNASVTGLTPGDIFLVLETAAGNAYSVDLGMRLNDLDDICFTSVDAVGVAITAFLRWET